VELKFIGTGSGKTSLKRYHSSFLINSGNFNLLVDAGDGISRALLNQKIIFNFINGILISHLHPDHFAGLPSLIVQMKMSERKEPLKIFCHDSNSYFIREFIYQSYLLESKLGFKLNIEPFTYKKKFRVSEGFDFIAKQNSHLENNINFDSDKRLEFSSGSFLISIHGKNIFYTGDIGSQKDLFLFQEKPDLMISEITHLSVDELVDAFRKIDPKKLFITHLSDEDEIKVTKLVYQLPAKERRIIVATFDGLNVKI